MKRFQRDSAVLIMKQRDIESKFEDWLLVPNKIK